MFYNIKVLEKDMQKFDVLEPYTNIDSSILILCPAASRISYKQGFYYGSKSNRFWSVIAEAFNMPTPESIEEKKALLKKSKIALWQLVCDCKVNPAIMRYGVDTLGYTLGDVDDPPYLYICTDIKSLISQYPIKKIILNGRKFYDLFIDNFPELVDMSIYLPNTSMANFRFDKEQWISTLKNLQTE